MKESNMRERERERKRESEIKKEKDFVLYTPAFMPTN